MRTIILVPVISLAVACAARNDVIADRSPAPITSVTAAVAMSTGATSPPGAAITPATSTGEQAETVDQSLVKRGYLPRRIKGQLRYCLSQTLTGTHFNDTVCLTAAQIKANDQNTKRDLDIIDRSHGANCPNNSC